MKTGRFYDAEGFVLCKECVERRVPPSYLRAYRYLCSVCYRLTPGQTRYRVSRSRRANDAKHNALRIRIGRQYYSHAKTVEDAQRINAHIRQRLNERRTSVTQ